MALRPVGATSEEERAFAGGLPPPVPGPDLRVEAEPVPLGSTRLQKCHILEGTASFPRAKANHPRTRSNDKRGDPLGNLTSNLSIGLESQRSKQTRGREGDPSHRTGTRGGPGSLPRLTACPGKAIPGIGPGRGASLHV